MDNKQTKKGRLKEMKEWLESDYTFHFICGTIFGLFLMTMVFLICINAEEKRNTPTVVGKPENAVVIPTTTVEETTEKATEEETTVVEKEEQTVETVKAANIECVWGGFKLTQADWNLLCATVYCETGHQSIDTQILATLCILNRVVIKEFPNSIYEVIYQPGAFEVAEKCDLWNVQWDEATEQAVAYALEENMHPYDLTCFNLYYYHPFGMNYCNIGNAYFTRYIPKEWGV